MSALSRDEQWKAWFLLWQQHHKGEMVASLIASHPCTQSAVVRLQSGDVVKFGMSLAMCHEAVVCRTLQVMPDVPRTVCPGIVSSGTLQVPARHHDARGRLRCDAAGGGRLDWIRMEFIPHTLADVLDSCGMHLARWALQLVCALHVLHDRARIIHHDLKPDNIGVRTGNRSVVLMDFDYSMFVGDKCRRTVYAPMSPCTAFASHRHHPLGDPHMPRPLDDFESLCFVLCDAVAPLPWSLAPAEGAPSLESQVYATLDMNRAGRFEYLSRLNPLLQKAKLEFLRSPPAAVPLWLRNLMGLVAEAHDSSIEFPVNRATNMLQQAIIAEHLVHGTKPVL